MSHMMQLMPAPPAALVLVALFGLAWGSFLNVLICRLPGGWRHFFAAARSRCPRCYTKIRWYDNVPLLGYLLLRGRCRDCGGRISPWYPLVELAMAVGVLVLFSVYSLSSFFFVYLVFFSLLLVIAVIDLRQMSIPDCLPIAGMCCGIAASLVTPLPGWPHALAGLACGITAPLLLVLVYEAWRHTTVMGGGDIKLLGMIGSFLGWQPLPEVVFYGALSGVLAALALLLSGRSTRLPFAPFLLLGTLMVLFGPDYFPSYR